LNEQIQSTPWSPALSAPATAPGRSSQTLPRLDPEFQLAVIIPISGNNSLFEYVIWTGCSGTHL
jgi:hypothetical protein